MHIGMLVRVHFANYSAKYPLVEASALIFRDQRFPEYRPSLVRQTRKVWLKPQLDSASIDTQTGARTSPEAELPNPRHRPSGGARA